MTIKSSAVTHPQKSAKKGTHKTKTKLIRDWAREYCAERWCKCQNRGNRYSLNNVIKEFNANEIGQSNGVRVSSRCVRRVLSNRPRVPGKSLATGLSGHSSYVYFQKVTKKGHSLVQNETNKQKEVLPPVDSEFMEGQINLLPYKRGAYIKTNLHSTPHGSSLLTDKRTNDMLCFKSKIPNTTIIHGGIIVESFLVRFPS